MEISKTSNAIDAGEEHDVGGGGGHLGAPVRFGGGGAQKGRDVGYAHEGIGGLGVDAQDVKLCYSMKEVRRTDVGRR
jgi:hypothetical protein